MPLKNPYQLPSMNALVCFEAAARHSSFKQAAEEMRVTPAAVSHQIKALEAELGQSLFTRRTRGVELTEKGALLFVALQRGFDWISGAVMQMSGRDETVDLTICSTMAVSSLWLTPKISAFWRNHPQIRIAQMVSETPVRGRHWDINVFYGEPEDDFCDYRELFRDRILAVGSSEFASRQGIGSLHDLHDAPLIDSNAENAHWTDWADWFSALGQPAPGGRLLSVNNYMIAVQTAMDGMGAVLGWEGLLKRQLREGTLIPLVPESVPASVGFYLRVHPRASAEARLFADWLAEAPAI